MIEKLPLRRLLDVRDAEAARIKPIFESVNIPFSELASRTHELPAKHVPIIVASGPSDSEAAQFLTDLGWQVMVSPNYRFAESGIGRLWEPNPLVETLRSPRMDAKAVDLGAGTGRESVYLASQGWQVTAIDNLSENPERGTVLQSRYAPDSPLVKWVTLDLPSLELVDHIAEVSLLTMFFYWDVDVFLSSVRHLHSQAMILVEVFNEVHHDKTGKPKNESAFVKLGELKKIANGLEILHYEEGELRGRNTTRMIARTP